MKKRWYGSKADCFFLCVFLIVFIFRIWKARYGIGSSDEHFYLTLPFRFLNGDAMLVDEWHIAQLIGFVLYPVMSIYRWFNPGMEGVVFHFRILYNCFAAIVAFSLYTRFHRYGMRAAIGALIYFVFTPFNIMALSYNTMSVGFLILAYCVYPFEEHRSIRYYCSGLLYAIAVLNTPYLVIVYFIWGFLYFRINGKLGVKNWLCLSLGVATAALSLLGFIFCRASISDILLVLPYLVDPSHSSSFGELLIRNGGKLILAYGWFFIAYLAELCILPFIRKNRKYQTSYKFICMGINLMSMVYISLIKLYYANMGGHALILVPFVLNGILYLVLDKNNDRILLTGICLSLLHAVLIMLSSNVGPRSFTPPLIFAAALLPMMETGKKKALFCYSCCFLILLGGIGSTRIYLGSDDYSTKVESGPLRGLYDSEETVSAMNERLKDMEDLNRIEDGYAALVTNYSWQYLGLTKPLSVNSAYLYFWDAEGYVECLETYYTIHDERKPVYVYVDDENQYGEELNDWLDDLVYIKKMHLGKLYQLN